ncbi:MAG: HU family DNA-binding protein [Nevskia sp.]|jgi:DNA-binding protein HU-beta|nr:HU family DNA-binding protein [Nevskia sp.]MCK9385072.1 HU family DNA-binding protein [Nevskia sp.]
MNKAELVKMLGETCDVPQAKAEQFLTSLSVIARFTLESGNDLTLPGVGKLKLGRREARKGRNPRTGETVDIPSKNIVKFVPANDLKTAVL